MSNSVSSASSRASSPASDRSAMFTPSRRVKTLLAQFSESDSDGDASREKKSTHRVARPNRTVQHRGSENEEEEEYIRPRGRMTARLQHATQRDVDRLIEASLGNPADDEQHHNFNLDVSQGVELDQTGSGQESSELVHRGQFMKKRKRGADEEGGISPRPTRSPSPLFVPQDGSPLSNTSQPSLQSGSPSRQPQDIVGGGSKFLALVQKHRRERLEREAAEVVARAAGRSEDGDPKPSRRVQRGSSPADDTAEDSDDSDDGAAHRISKQTRPTRKASKKAIEEMNRETQRMTRNMQLAHQARTKTKITKESLLARFNFLPEQDVAGPSANLGHSSTSNSARASDAESEKEHSTPSTSPLRQSDVMNSGKAGTVTLHATDMHRAPTSADLLPPFGGTETRDSPGKGRQKINYQARNRQTTSSPKATSPGSSHARFTKPAPVRVSVARTLVPSVYDSDSDDAIEIVRDRGSKRKYAAFEMLPKRKAKETPSHLALRSLAHLMSNDTRRKAMNAAEMELSLRRQARLQAQEERKEKIELLKAKGILVQTAEDREREQQEVEDLVEKARQEAVEIQKREKAIAKKDGTYVDDGLDDEGESEDEDYDEGEIDSNDSDSDGDEHGDGDDDDDTAYKDKDNMVESDVEEASSGEEESDGNVDEGVTATEDDDSQLRDALRNCQSYKPRRTARAIRVLSDDEDEEEESLLQEQPRQAVVSPQLPRPAKTPQSVSRSARKIIPGLQMSDDLPMGLSQAFAATMADSQTQASVEPQQHDDLDLAAGMPSPSFAPIVPLRRLDSLDLISDSMPATQIQASEVMISHLQSQAVPQSPALSRGPAEAEFTPSQHPFELTQDAGYMLSPFTGSRFTETPKRPELQSTIETVIIPVGDEGPIVQRKGKLRRGQRSADLSGHEETQLETAFDVLHQAARQKQVATAFDKKRSEARNHVEEDAEESEDEYAGLGGASDDEVGEENEEDRRMIDEDTEVGKGDEAKLAALYADRERAQDEQDVSKLLKDITTGALRRKRGAGDDLDLSDEEDAAVRRREAKRREFAKMRRELLKDEAVGKIAEDRKKEAFLLSIEDREMSDNDDGDDAEDTDFTGSATQGEDSHPQRTMEDTDRVPDSQTDLRHATEAGSESQHKLPLKETTGSTLNRKPSNAHRNTRPDIKRKPATLFEIRENVSFLIEEPDSQAATVDLGLSDSEDDEEAYVDLNRHLRAANDEMDDVDDDEDLNGNLDDFIVDDADCNSVDIPANTPSQGGIFKKPSAPARAPFSERRTNRANVVDRLSLLRQTSSNSSTTSVTPGSTSTASTTTTSAAAVGGKMAFFTSRTNSFTAVPTLLRRATTNCSLGSMSGRESVSATGVTTALNSAGNGTERGRPGDEKEFIRKAKGGRSNAVNFHRPNLREEKMSERAGVQQAREKAQAKARAKSGARGGGAKVKGGFLGGLFGSGSWE